MWNTRIIGFKTEIETQTNKENILVNISPQDLKTYGLIPELIGRLPIVTHLDPLDKEALKRILIEPKNSLIKQYKKLFYMDDINLIVDNKSIELIVDKALELGLGARGLRSICEIVMREFMFNAPSEKSKREIRITSKYVKSKLDRFSLSTVA